MLPLFEMVEWVMEKVAVGRQTSKFMQTRSGIRPLRVDTLINKQSEVPDSFKELWIETPAEASSAPDSFEEGFAHLEGEEFGAEPERKIDPVLNRIAKEAAELKTKLLPYQKRVIRKLEGQPGLVVAHGTGTGKTLSSIGAIADLNPDKARVFVPAALQENYKKEIEKHVEGKLPVQVETIEKAVRSGRPPRGDLLVIDEAHRLRNPFGKSHELIAGSKASKRMLLTASPVYNKPEDVAALVNLAAGSRQLPIGGEFNREFIRKPSGGLFSIINPFARKEPTIVNRRKLGKVLNKWVDYQGGHKEGFPSLSEERVNVTMSKRQTDLHNAAWDKLPIYLRARMMRGLPPERRDISRLNSFQAQTRQLSSSEKKYTMGEYEPTPKIMKAVGRLEKNINKNPNHKALVYANYLGTLDDYSKELKQKEIPHALFRGDMSKKKRDEAVRQLNRGDIKALLVSGAGAEGLDLKGVRQVQVLEPHWNDERLRQVIGRARRYKSHEHLPSGERNVHVERYAARPRGKLFGTNKGVEDTLYDLSDQKQRLNDQVMELLTKESELVEPRWKKRERLAKAIRRRVGYVRPQVIGDEWMFEG